MLAPRQMPREYLAWNRRWGAPRGRVLHRWLRRVPLLGRIVDRSPRLASFFAFQPNNTSRRYEYPWAFHATPLVPGMRALEIGGSLSGFQFVLAKSGLSVVNCDPGKAARGRGWPVTPTTFRALNDTFKTDVELRNTFLQDAGLADESFDRVFSISTIEHIPETELPALMQEIERVLKPGGYFIATVDLFLDLEPFTAGVTTNRWGTNIDISALCAATSMQRIIGDPPMLYGFDAFDAAAIRPRIPELLVGSYPVLIQCLVLQKRPHSPAPSDV